MKFLHIADTHLGYSAYRKATPDGINQRETDTYAAFKQFIDYSVKSKPDLIIHAGDLFDSVRPNNRAITFAIDQILRVSKDKIPFVIIAGNHEHPKLKETGHIFSIFDHIENVHPIYKAKYETLSFDIKKEKITIHAVPQCELKNKFEDEIKKVKPDKSSNYNIFVSHGAVSGIRIFSMNEFNEIIINPNDLSKDFDDQYLLIEAKPVSQTSDKVHGLEDSLEETAKHVEHFSAHCHEKLGQWKNRLQQIHAEKRRAVVWGSSSKCVAFMTTLGVKNEIEYVIDINPYRHGKFIPGAGKQIMPPEFLREYRPDVTIVMNPIYCHEIEEMLDDMGVATEVTSI